MAAFTAEDALIKHLSEWFPTGQILVILGIAFWIAFHVMQARVEAGELADAERDFNAEHSKNSIDRY